MSDFDEGMVLRRIGELIEEGELPPIAHGLLRLLGIAIEQEAALEQAQVERDRFREVLTNIGDNFGGDPVWLARVVLERWHFAEYDSAPEWFQEAALAATEEATDAET